MRRKKWKDGDIAVAVTNGYGCTNEHFKWKGKVTRTFTHHFHAKTLSCDMGSRPREMYYDLYKAHFKHINELEPRDRNEV